MLPVREERPRPTRVRAGQGGPNELSGAQVPHSHLAIGTGRKYARAAPIERHAQHQPVLAAEGSANLPAAGRIPEIDVPWQVARRDLLAVGRVAKREDRILMVDRTIERMPRQVPDRDLSREARHRQILSIRAEIEILQRSLDLKVREEPSRP